MANDDLSLANELDALSSGSLSDIIRCPERTLGPEFGTE